VCAAERFCPGQLARVTLHLELLRSVLEM
jgi:hypothetical protein